MDALTSHQTALDSRGLGAFLAVAFGLPWAGALAFYLAFGPNGSQAPVPFSLLATGSMLAPSLATLVAARWVSPLASLRHSEC
jgi:hypothetical protein